MGRIALWIILPVITGAVFGIVTVFTHDIDSKLDVSVAALGIVLGAQLELTRRLQKRYERYDRAGRVIAEVEQLPDDLASTVQENVALLTTAVHSSRGDPIYRRILKERLVDQHTWLERFNAGIIEVESDDTKLLLDWTTTVRHSIKATMVARTDIHWWHSRPGRQLWQTNLDALHRGVNIQRVFMADKVTPELEELIREQLDAGVEAYVVTVDELRADLHIDLTIVDDKRIHEVMFSSGGNAMGYRYSQEPGRVNNLTAKFERILQSATPAAEFDFSD